ncbi:YihY/virulence factor BrkB family protein [Natrinema versiforme]|uniref:YihY/virulence factor BrkB family protein n=1 Tax=Natrinema versiforme TaxID=88724 RepID=A0A4V1FZH4_9EURY|nr:YihY/virulence factor BrkB family protein [Natrinema versiforme]QCS41856.1 YihY/virulence factor BrkB family protein [Natrinema versiforme]
MRASSLTALAHDVAAIARERQLSVAAAGLAYHAFNTVVPLVILALVGASLVDALEPILEVAVRETGLEGTVSASDLEAVAGDGGGRIRAALLASAILCWSAARLFQAVNSAFLAVYDGRKEQSYADAATSVTLVTVCNAVLLTATVAVGVALVGVIGAGVPTGNGGLVATILVTLSLTVLLFAAFFPMYYLFPQPAVSVREVLPGTAVAALAWTALAVGFRLYAAASESVALFGVAGAVLIVLTWVYLGGLCLLLGAVLNAVLADRVNPETEWLPLRNVWSKYA